MTSAFSPRSYTRSRKVIEIRSIENSVWSSRQILAPGLWGKNVFRSSRSESKNGPEDDCHISAWKRWLLVKFIMILLVHSDFKQSRIPLSFIFFMSPGFISARTMQKYGCVPENRPRSRMPHKTILTIERDCGVESQQCSGCEVTAEEVYA
jgi:hypothetical protein